MGPVGCAVSELVLRLRSAFVAAVGGGAVQPVTVAGRFVHPAALAPARTTTATATVGQYVRMLAPSGEWFRYFLPSPRRA
jgi:hypothetical protein